ncbi:MAG TPA: ubiquinol-cytochrome c reductase iron-sulfur subunit [Chloroflexota bacterium]
MPKQFFQLQGLGEMRSRRRFLTNLTLGLSGLIGAALGVPLIGYLLGPLIKPTPNAWQTVGNVSDFPDGQTTLAKLSDPSSLPWAGQTADTAVWVRNLGQQQFEVFAVNCTHLGCPVNWIGSANLFECPCHGGVYYANGQVAAGPPPHALFQHPVRVVGQQVQVQTAPLPATPL